MEDDVEYGKSDQSFLRQIGAFTKSLRLSARLTQAELAERTGLNRTTISQLENDGGATLATLLRVLRVLGRLDVLQQFEVQEELSPALMAKMAKRKRQRVKHSTLMAREPDVNYEKPLNW